MINVKDDYVGTYNVWVEIFYATTKIYDKVFDTFSRVTNQQLDDQQKMESDTIFKSLNQGSKKFKSRVYHFYAQLIFSSNCTKKTTAEKWG